MPKVQPYEPQVRPSPLQIPAQRLDPRGAFGEALVEGASRFASSMERIQDEDDKAVVKDRINQYRERSRARMFGDDDAFLNKQGKAAYDSRNAARDELSKYRDELSQGLSGNQQRMFSPLSQEYLDRDFDNIAKHAQKSRISWLNSEDEAAIESAQNDHALYWKVGDGENIRQIRGLVNNIAQRNGWGPEQKELKLEAALTAAHQSAIDNILTDNPRGAEAYFLEHKGEISPKVWDDINKKIDTAKTNGMAQSIADEAMLQPDLSQAREHIKNKLGDEPEAREKANRIVAEEYRIREHQENELRNDWFTEGDLFRRDPNQSIEQWKSQNPDKWAFLTPQQRTYLESKPSVETDLQAYNEVRGLIANGENDRALEKINQGRFSASDSKKLIDLMYKPKPERKNLQTDLAYGKDRIVEAIGPQPPKSKTEKHQLWQAQYNSLIGWYQEEIDKWYEDNPNKENIDNTARKEILDRLNLEVMVEDAGWFYFDASQGLSDIPKEDYVQIVQKLEVDGKPVTPENILRLYQAGQEQ
jgi:hypothetical protein